MTASPLLSPSEAEPDRLVELTTLYELSETLASAPLPLEALEGFETFYCGGGSRERLLEIRFADVVRLNGAIVVAISG